MFLRQPQYSLQSYKCISGYKFSLLPFTYSIVYNSIARGTLDQNQKHNAQAFLLKAFCPWRNTALIFDIVLFHMLKSKTLQHLIYTEILEWYSAGPYSQRLPVKLGSQPHARFFDRTIFCLIPIFGNRIRFYQFVEIARYL